MRKLTAKKLAGRIDLSYFKRTTTLTKWRRGLIVLCCAGALLWAGLFVAKGNNRVYNPGPVAAVHAMWESDCAKCHVPNGKGGFFQAVSDQACLQCHDGAIHHPHQILRAGGDANNPVALAAADADGRLRSANCTACHTEHRGRAALISSDAHCVQCHGDLPRAVAANVTLANELQVIKTFAPGAHPPFGLLPAPGTGLAAEKPMSTGGALVLRDTTVLRFPHEKHLPKRDAAESEQAYQDRLSARCAQCHSTRQPNPLAQPLPANAESLPLDEKWKHVPVALPTDPAPSLSGSSSLRYMQPVSYERHCAICHAIKTPGPAASSGISPRASGRTVWHVGLDRVHDQMQAELAVLTTGSGAKFVEVVPAKPPRKATEKPMTKEQWMQKTADALLEQMKKAPKDALVDKLAASIKSAPPAGGGASAGAGKAATQPAGMSDAAFANWYTAAVAVTACTECHQVKGSLPSTAAASGATGAAAGAFPLATVPTGIPSSPRRWFANSRFDHDAHRSQSCASCHDWTSPAGGGEAKSADVYTGTVARLPSLESCVNCHHEPTMADHGAGAECVTCHVFHDRSKERMPGIVPAKPAKAETVSIATPEKPAETKPE